jgi:hypothetical protein
MIIIVIIETIVIAGLLAMLIPQLFFRQWNYPESLEEPAPSSGLKGNVRLIPGEIVEEDTPRKDAFFDEHDLAAAEAHEERPEFIHTTIEVNGIPAGPDGVVPLQKEKGWLRR